MAPRPHRSSPPRSLIVRADPGFARILIGTLDQLFPALGPSGQAARACSQWSLRPVTVVALACGHDPTRHFVSVDERARRRRRQEREESERRVDQNRGGALIDYVRFGAPSGPVAAGDKSGKNQKGVSIKIGAEPLID